ncbi:hypothetical protein FHT40_002445 [Mycolicibacterium sp. BK556]|uniref:hypothetical protein n=1 Tax=unclassified Mycolicibacterium TaxID=2636767 RepID=UPI001795AE09|nr:MULTISPECIES: hypothetical protein [unclassified Mycolicibacterium]MBB3602784.1 hypothetical protein [Mycolicibacterium sp. BK556]MBB3632979.1 hypothetical protein [Mycolicibacterium sp. BK607]
MEIGDECIYRLKTYSPSERIKILGIEKRKQTTRVDVEFLDGQRSGERENVPGTRLRGPWGTVAQYDERMANWQRLESDGLDETEEWAVGEVFSTLIPDDVATYDDSMVRHGTTVRDSAALEQLLDRPISDVLDQVEWFGYDDVLQLSADGTLLIAQYVCGVNPAPILENVMAEEAERREYSKRGREYDAIDGSGKRTSSPEREYERYVSRYRPIHELLRGWCGHRAVTFVERLTAAEAEVRRLDILVAELVDALKEHQPHHADALEQRHNEERIRHETVRPVVERPLAPWEIPVREVRVRGRRWW